MVVRQHTRLPAKMVRQLNKTNRFFVAGKAGVSPDLTIFGKAVGGGMPVGAYD